MLQVRQSASALGLTQAEMDRRMGSALTNGQTLNFYETGRQRIPTLHAYLPRNVQAQPLRGRNKGGLGGRRQTTDETSSREVGFFLRYSTPRGGPMPDPTSLLEIGARLAVT